MVLIDLRLSYSNRNETQQSDVESRCPVGDHASTLGKLTDHCLRCVHEPSVSVWPLYFPTINTGGNVRIYRIPALSPGPLFTR